MTPAPTTAPVNERVAALLNDLIADASAAGAEHLAERLRDEASRWRSKETTVVVAGEPNRGKSSLLNALLGREILPAGANLVTDVYVVLRHGDAEGAVLHEVGGGTRNIRVDEVASWAAGGAVRGIEGITVTLDHAVLRNGLILVDTPGVGGLDAAHGRLTMSILSRADALVFLLDPTEPLSRTELDFLARATDRLDRVLFVMTKVDQSPGHRTIADDDRALIDRHAPRFSGAPLLPVSAALKLRADSLAASGKPDNSLVDESGVPELGRTLLRSVVARLATVRLANLLRLAATVVDELERPWQDTLVATQGEPEAKQLAAELQVEIDELRDNSERLSVDVTDRFNALRELAGSELTRIVRDLTTTFGRDTQGAESDSGQTLAALDAELAAALGELGERLTAEIDAMRADVDEAVGGVELEPEPLVLSGPPLASTGAATSSDEPSDQTLRVRIMSAGTSSVMAMALFGTRLQGFANGDEVDFWNVFLLLLMGGAAVAGVIVAVLNVQAMKRQTAVIARRREVQAALDSARTELSPVIRQQLLTAQRELERAMRSQVRGRSKDLQARLADAQQLARTDATKREQRREEAQRALGAIAGRRQHADQLAAEVAALGGAAPTAG